MALVRIGRVARAIGLKGHVGVAGTSGGLASLREIWLEASGSERRARRILEARPQGRLWALQLEGIGDREAAECCVGAEVLAERDELGDAGEGLHYWADLEGLAVETVGGERVGTVTGLLETGGVDVLVVTAGDVERLVPLAPYVTVDLAARRVVVDPPEGLLELALKGEQEEEEG
jgi:16S rRNA processing protein RimM